MCHFECFYKETEKEIKIEKKNPRCTKYVAFCCTLTNLFRQFSVKKVQARDVYLGCI